MEENDKLIEKLGETITEISIYLKKLERDYHENPRSYGERIIYAEMLAILSETMLKDLHSEIDTNFVSVTQKLTRKFVGVRKEEDY